MLELEKDPNLAYEYTDKGNLVAVVSNGTAILGLGNRGALASKPVMEGKGVLFKAFADVDVFDIEVDFEDPDEVIKVVQLIAPTFGGINLEDIKAPECFYIEKRLKELLDIPVFHDDQHGTAIILGAAILNAMEITQRDPKNTKVVFSGAGAAGISCANQLLMLGFKKENLWLTDSKGLVYIGRQENMSEQKASFANGTHPPPWQTFLKAQIFSSAYPQPILSPRIWSNAWHRNPLSSPWRILTQRSSMILPGQPDPMPSLATGGLTSPTRSTMCWGFPLFSVVP